MNKVEEQELRDLCDLLPEDGQVLIYVKGLSGVNPDEISFYDVMRKFKYGSLAGIDYIDYVMPETINACGWLPIPKAKQA